MEMMNRGAEDRARKSRELHLDWSDADWDNVLRKAMEPQTRQDTQGRWEYLIHGQWVNQSTFDDPMFQQNIYNPWRADVENYWRGKREKAQKYKQQQAEAEAAREAEKYRKAQARRGGSMGQTVNRGY